mgnify:CR=1 FL=1
MQTKIYKYPNNFPHMKPIQYVEDNGEVIGKECSECDKIKKLTEFYTSERGLFGHTPKCKECFCDNYANDAEYRKKEIKRNIKNYYNSKTDHWTIYLIDNFNGKGDHYVGITQHLGGRLSKHRYSGADTSYYLIMDTAPTQKLALKYEAEYHERGYCGAKGCTKYKEMKDFTNGIRSKLDNIINK